MPTILHLSTSTLPRPPSPQNPKRPSLSPNRSGDRNRCPLHAPPTPTELLTNPHRRPAHLIRLIDPSPTLQQQPHNPLPLVEHRTHQQRGAVHIAPPVRKLCIWAYSVVHEPFQRPWGPVEDGPAQD